MFYLSNGAVALCGGSVFNIANRHKIRARDGYAPDANCLWWQSRSGCYPDRALYLLYYTFIESDFKPGPTFFAVLSFYGAAQSCYNGPAQSQSDTDAFGA